MNANLNGSGRSCGGNDSNSFLALIHYTFGSSVDPGYFIYGNNRESRRGLTLKVYIALGQGVKVRLRGRGGYFNNRSENAGDPKTISKPF
jgi:hypothetical protein